MTTNKRAVSDSDTENTAAESETTEPTTAPPETERERYAGVKTFAYVGPSLPGGKLKSNTILGGTYAEITEYYKDAIALYPGAEKLIVPVARLAEAREKTQNSGNVMYKYYQELAAGIQAKGDEN